MDNEFDDNEQRELMEDELKGKDSFQIKSEQLLMYFEETKNNFVT